RSPNLDSIALTGITIRWADRDCRFRWLKSASKANTTTKPARQGLGNTWDTIAIAVFGRSHSL
ncbi:hypothetical protein, partial [Microcoleus sp. B4-C3]|uniref:hypothetical protein n=1 Tax=Microcoleus sp. B4-C3 TaxID=2818662 RepID=UPI002FD1DD09